MLGGESAHRVALFIWMIFVQIDSFKFNLLAFGVKEKQRNSIFFLTEMTHLIHPNEVVISLRQFVQDHRQPQK